jgi:beta-galactosidase/beta-glucuronidase
MIKPPEQHPTRLELPLNDGWRFRPGRVDRDWLRGAWRKDGVEVELPHCWNETDTFQLGLAYRQGDGAYGCCIDLPPVPGEGIWQLRTEGFYGYGALWLNGRRFGRIDGQYLGLTLDLTHHLLAGRPNTIALQLANRYRRFVLPGKRNPDFLLYGGLSGRVRLVHLPAIHLDDQSLRVTCRNVLTTCPTVRVAVALTNTSRATGRVNLRFSISDASGAVVAEDERVAQDLPGLGTRTAEVELPIRNPRLWDLAQPHCYRATCELRHATRTIDRVTTSFGIREARFDGQKGFFLNDAHVALHGVNRHESMPGFGRALPDSLHRADAEQIKRLGLNFVRLSHYPQHPSFLDACDAQGLLIYAEIASWKSVRPGWWSIPACRQFRAMLMRDRNHPSIVLWGLGNESCSRLVFGRLAHIAKIHDPDRATVYAENHLHRGIRWRTLRQTEVLGINYELDRLEDAHALSRKGALVVSEISNCAYTQRGDLAAERKQLAAVTRDAARMADKPYVAGYALWCWSDYASQRKGRCTRRSGIVDAWRAPKLTAAYLQALLTRAPCLHVFGNWSRNASETERTVHVCSNAAHVTVSIDGQPIVDCAARPHLELTVPYQAKPLVVTARHADGTATAARLPPCGDPVAIAAASATEQVRADERPTFAIDLRVVDADGYTVTDCMGHARATLTGPGRPRLFTADGRIELSGGTGRFFVTATGQTGTLEIVCTAVGLKPATVAIACR